MNAVPVLDTASADFETRFRRLLARDTDRDAGIEPVVRDIIDRVCRRGDAALLEYTERFDRQRAASVAELELPKARLNAALDSVPASIRRALESAAARIRAFHEREVSGSWEFEDADGNRLGQRLTPIDRVGIYVPGGQAVYPSSLLMGAIPARVAGVRELVMVVPTPGGNCDVAVLAAAAVAGVDRVFRIGGAQAVAALAFGTETVPRVDKVVGPGNIYVATAKRLLYGQVGIDTVAGPSEVVVICDGSADPEWVAMDLFAQAEHDERAQSVLLSPDSAQIEAVRESIERWLPRMERRELIGKALLAQGALIHTRSVEEAITLANRMAPEHLELMVDDAAQWAEHVRHAGAIFIGPHSAESLGDYCVGPNHVLPTAGTARFASPLGVYDFQKRTNIIHCTRRGASALAPVAAELALAEGLTAHARSAELRQ